MGPVTWVVIRGMFFPWTSRQVRQRKAIGNRHFEIPWLVWLLLVVFPIWLRPWWVAVIYIGLFVLVLKILLLPARKTKDLSRQRELLIGLLFVLAPVFMFIPVMQIQVYAPSKWWTDRIEGAAYLLVILCELWGVRRLLNWRVAHR